jgi:hypothetical protein
VAEAFVAPIVPHLSWRLNSKGVQSRVCGRSVGMRLRGEKMGSDIIKTKATELFKLYDQDRSGFIDWEEYANVIKKFEQRAADAGDKKDFLEADANTVGFEYDNDGGFLITQIWSLCSIIHVRLNTDSIT